VAIDTKPDRETGETLVRISEVQLMRYDLPTRSLHAHLTYTVVGAANPGTPVTSGMLLLDLDPRGD
jgi:hypothetical protein